MSNLKLKSRIEAYQELSDYKLLSRIPLIICVNGRSFSKVTSLLEKPYCVNFAECMFSTMLKLCTEIEGTIFAYQNNDEIVIIARNDQTTETNPWYDNKIQKISSVTASIATLHFNRCISNMELNYLNDPIFTASIFTVPNIVEAINTIIYKQQKNFHNSIQLACFYELLNKKYDKETIKEMLIGLSIDDKIDLLSQECNIDFNQYPISFRRGAACYKVPKLEGQVLKNKWFLNKEPPIFAKEQSFLSNIFKHGCDIFRSSDI